MPAPVVQVNEKVIWPNPKYHMVLVAANWTVVSTDPAAGSVLNYPGDRVVVNVTKP